MYYKIDFNKQPILVFWEVTKACPLKCKHCRAEAILEPLPGELSTEEGYNLIYSITRFGKPYPVLIFTGGDPLSRSDIFDLIKYAIELDIKVGLAPTVSEKLNEEVIRYLSRLGVKYISISLDGAYPDTHDSIRGLNGHFNMTISVLKKLVRGGFKVQVNTIVLRENVGELPYMVKLLKDIGVNIWEVFFLIKVGRGIELNDLTPIEYEDVMHFLYDTSKYDIEVRTVEAPFFRRVVLWRREDDSQNINYIRDRYKLSKLYEVLASKLRDLMGSSQSNPKAYLGHTRDGYGIIFISHDGRIYPSGFCEYELGNIRVNDLVEVYRNNSILKAIREARFNGRCGICEYRYMCGGSRARAYTTFKNILAEDPACIYNPQSNSLNSILE